MYSLYQRLVSYAHFIVDMLIIDVVNVCRHYQIALNNVLRALENKIMKNIYLQDLICVFLSIRY